MPRPYDCMKNIPARSAVWGAGALPLHLPALFGLTISAPGSIIIPKG